MSLSLLLDEDTQANRLIHLLREAGHDVMTVTEAGLLHKSDEQVLDHAGHLNRFVVTRNCGHFHALRLAKFQAAGVLAIYQHQTASDLSDKDIVQAIVALEAYSEEVGWSFMTEFIILNQWHWS